MSLVIDEVLNTSATDNKIKYKFTPDGRNGNDRNNRTCYTYYNTGNGIEQNTI